MPYFFIWHVKRNAVNKANQHQSAIRSYRLNQFLAFVRKELWHIWRDKRTLLILFGMPLAQIIIFGFALTNEVKNSSLAVWDQSGSETTRKLTAQLDASAYFDLTHRVYHQQQAEELLRSGKVKQVIVIPADFDRSLQQLNQGSIQLLLDATDPNVATTIRNYASSIIQDFLQTYQREKQVPYRIQAEVRMLYNPALNGSYAFVPGVMAMILMLVSSMMTSIALVKERETGTMEVILVSPLHPLSMVLAKMVPYLILSMVNVSSILLLSVSVLDVPVRGSVVLLFGVAFIFTITSLSLGLLISSIAGSQQVAMLISLMGLFLPTIMFSGFMFPIENMPLPMQVISNLVPAKWFYYAVRTIMIEGQGLWAIKREVMVLLLMTIGFLTISIRKFNIRLA